MFTVRIKQNPLEVEFDAASIEEAHKVLSDNESEISRIFGLVQSTVDNEGSSEEDNSQEKPQRRKRRTKAEMEAARASEAAPAPVPAAPATPPAAPVPAAPVAPPVAPVPAAPVNVDEIPAFLKRDTGAPTAPAPIDPPAAPMPPVPTTPPTPPAAPVANIDAALSKKVVDNLRQRANGAVDKGQALADWLANVGIVVKGATFEEALSVIQLTEVSKLNTVATALGVG